MGAAILSGLNGLIFIAWAVMMFRTLFAQRRRAAARTGKMIPGVGDTLAEWKHWWHSPDLARGRRVLIALTLALLASLAAMVITANAGG